jgi:subtilisin family serine protease
MNLTSFLTGCSGHQTPIPSFKGTNYYQNLSSRFSEGHKVLINKNHFKSEHKNPKVVPESAPENEKKEEAKEESIKEDSHYLKPEDVLNPDFSLAVLYKNSCLANKAKELGYVFEIKEILMVNTENRNMSMEVQAYPSQVLKEVSVSQLNEALKTDPCIIGLTQNNQFIQMQFDDPLFKKQFHHRVLKTTSSYDSYFKNLSINSPSVRIAVIDSGIDSSHPDLKQHIWKNPQGQDVTNFSNQPNSLDKAGHGTHIAGLIGAQGNNKTGVVGVLNAGEYQLMAIKVVNQKGNSDAIAIVNGALYAIENNAEVINLSLGSDGFNDLFIEVIRRAYFKNITDSLFCTIV